MSPMNIAVAGASGRMGRMVIAAIQSAQDARLAGALDVPGAPTIGTDAEAFHGKISGVPIESDFGKGLANARYLIDFTHPQGTLKHLEYCALHGIKMIIGTTGFDEAGKTALIAAAKKTAIVFSPSFSTGVNVMMKLLEMAAKNFSCGYDVEIIEAHSRHKIDAPSGTALKLGEVIAGAHGRMLDDVAIFSRDQLAVERDSSSIGFCSVRGGNIVSEHTVLFAGAEDRLEITHKCDSRVVYAEGSLRAARFLAHKQTGLYDMQDVLGLATPIASLERIDDQCKA